MRKRVIGLLLAATLLSVSLAGCGNEQGSDSTQNSVSESMQNNESDSAEETSSGLEEKFNITYTGYWCDDTYKDGSYCEKMIEDALNIDLEVVTTGGSNTLDVLLASGQMPDCIWSDYDLAWMQDQELIRTIPVSMVEQYCPSIIEYYDAYPQLYKAVLNPENEEEFTYLTGITLQFVDYYLPGDFYRYDWIQNLGIDLGVEVEQVSDRLYVASDGIEMSKFIEIMDAFVNQDPDGNGVADTVGVTAQNLQQPQFFSGYGFHRGVNNVNGEAEKYYVLDEFKEYLKGFAQLYADGLIDTEIIENNRKLSWDKVNTGKAGYWITSTNALNTWASDRPPLTLMEKDPEAAILVTPGLKPDGGEVQAVTNSSPAYGRFYVNVNVDDEKLARILQFVEYAIWGNGGDLDIKASLFYGEKGVDWEWNEDGTTPVQLNNLASGEKGTWSFSQHGQDEVVTRWTGEEPLFTAGGKYWSKNQDGSWMKWQHVEYKEDLANETEYANIGAQINNDIDAYVSNYVAQAVLGQIDVDSTWDSYLSELDRMGYNEMMAELDKLPPLEEMMVE